MKKSVYAVLLGVLLLGSVGAQSASAMPVQVVITPVVLAPRPVPVIRCWFGFAWFFRLPFPLVRRGC